MQTSFFDLENRYPSLSKGGDTLTRGQIIDATFVLVPIRRNSREFNAKSKQASPLSTD